MIPAKAGVFLQTKFANKCCRRIYNPQNARFLRIAAPHLSQSAGFFSIKCILEQMSSKAGGLSLNKPFPFFNLLMMCPCY